MAHLVDEQRHEHHADPDRRDTAGALALVAAGENAWHTFQPKSAAASQNQRRHAARGLRRARTAGRRAWAGVRRETSPPLCRPERSGRRRGRPDPPWHARPALRRPRSRARRPPHGPPSPAGPPRRPRPRAAPRMRRRAAGIGEPLDHVAGRVARRDPARRGIPDRPPRDRPARTRRGGRHVAPHRADRLPAGEQVDERDEPGVPKPALHHVGEAADPVDDHRRHARGEQLERHRTAHGDRRGRLADQRCACGPHRSRRRGRRAPRPATASTSADPPRVPVVQGADRKPRRRARRPDDRGRPRRIERQVALDLLAARSRQEQHERRSVGRVRRPLGARPARARRRRDGRRACSACPGP